MTAWIPTSSRSPSIIPLTLNQLVYHDKHVYKLWIRIEETWFRSGLFPLFHFPLCTLEQGPAALPLSSLSFPLSLLLSLSTRSLLENHDVLGCRADVCVLSSPHLSLSPISFLSDSLARPLALQWRAPFGNSTRAAGAHTFWER